MRSIVFIFVVLFTQSIYTTAFADPEGWPVFWFFSQKVS